MPRKSLHSSINNLSYKSLLIILFFLLISIVVLWKFVLPNHKVEASWWNDGWNYRKAISINNSGTAQTNTQIKILDNYDLSALVTAGKLQADLDDLRFTDINGNLLKYWIEDSTNNSVDVWGIISSLPASGTTIYMYYGNSSATSVSSTLNITIGGTMTSINGYRIHTFLGNGTLTNANNITAEVLVVAGGGGGGSSTGTGGGGAAGGGAGGLTYNASYTLTKGQIINVTVGIGGTNGATSLNQVGTDGGTSIFGTITVNGGGGGANTGANGRPGGSGGGGGYNYYSTVKYGGAGVVGIGNSGGATTDLTSAAGAGGGGAGGAGGNNKPSHVGGDGGAGIPYSITGVGVTYASGGRGGGGAAPVVKAVNTGNGGDGAYSTGTPTSGASGIVVVRFLSGTASAPSAEEVGGGPIAYWKFDEGTGTTAYDSTSNQNNGTLGTGNSAPTWANESQCIAGKCLKFDGSNDYINAGANPSLNFGTNSFSVFTWVKFNSNTANQYFINGRTVGSSRWHLYVNSSNVLSFWIADSGGTVANSTIGGYNANQWYYLGFVRDKSAGKVYFYKDGKLITSTNDSTNNITSQGVYLGAFDGSGSWFNGFLDEPKIYPYARTAAQIKKDYNSRGGSSQGTSANLGTAGSDNNLSEGLVGYWKMDETSWNGTTGEVKDSSGNNNNGTAGGTTLPSLGNGKFGNSAQFNGINNYITIGYTNPITATSVVAWFKRLGTPAGGYHIITGGGNIEISIPDPGGQIRTGVITSTMGRQVFNSGSGLLDGNWHQVAMTYDGSKLVSFIDGVQTASNSVSGNLSGTAGEIGRYLSNSYVTNGFIDEVRIYNRALSPSEVNQLYNYAPEPIFYWDFNEGIGTTAFDKQNHTNLPISNATYTAGKIGSGLNFNGNAWLEKTISPSIPAARDYTQCLWFNPSNSATRQVLIDDSNQWEHWIAIDTNKTVMACYYNTTQICATSTNTVSLNTWNYVCSTYKAGQSLDLFVNGVPWATNTNVGSSASKIYDDVCIGKAGGGSNGKFTGKIDDVKIYNYARTQKQIIEDMNASHPAVSANSAIAYYKFDEGYGTSVIDWGLGKNNGTFTGSTLPTWSNNGKFNKAVNFDNTTGSITIGDPTNEALDPGTNDFTISYWIKTNPSSTWILPIYKGGSSINTIGYDFELSSATHKLNFNLADSNSHYYTVTTSSSIDDNNWHHIVGVIDRSGALGTPQKSHLFVDGKEEGTPVNISLLESLNNSYPFDISKAGYTIKGLIDDVKIYKYALTAEDIKQDYNAGSALQMGQTSQTIGGTTTSLEYCIPGDTSYCASPVAEWKMDEGSGTSAKDTSGNNLAGTITGATWAQGKIGKALNFSGSSQYVTITDNTLLKPTTAITAEAWFNTTDKTATQVIISKTESSGYSAYIYGNDRIQFAVNVLGTYHTATYPISNINTNQWYHFTGIYDGSAVKIYLNGLNVGITNTTTGSITQGTPPLCIGSEPGSTCQDGGGQFFKGKIDGVKIYDYARTPAQIAYDYNKGGPVGWWKFDECQGNIAYDWSGIGNTGTIIIGASGTQNSLGTCAVGTSAAWTNGATGKINSSLNFDGTDDTINIGNTIPFTTSISLSTWVFPTLNPSSYGGFLSTENHSTHTGISMWFINNKFYFGQSHNSRQYTDNINRDINNWYHATVTYDNGSWSFYINGKKTYSVTNQVATLNNAITIGRLLTSYTSGYYFPGKIDDVRIYNYALTAEQVKTLYNNGAVNFN